MRAQALSYHHCSNALPRDAQLQGAYLGGFCLCVADDGHSLHLEDEDCNEERKGRTTPLKDGDRRDLVVAVTHSAGHS